MSFYEKYKVDIPPGKSGEWRVEKFTVPKWSIEGMRAAMAGRSIDPGEYTKLMRGGCLVMSDTPAEIADCVGLFSVAKGRGLLNGLGLGMCLRGVLLNKEVEHVTVIEKSPDVIKLVIPHLNYNGRLSVVCGDAFEYSPDKGTKFDFVWHDVWNSICGDNYEGMKKLHRKYGRMTKWQESWCRYQVRQASR